MQATSRRYWEYKDFIYVAWEPQETWSCVTYKDNFWIAEARQFFWETARERIKAELQKWLDDGWEPIEDVSADAIVMSQTERKVNNSTIADVLLWFMTLGIAFILQSWLNNPRRITVYTPVEFRIKMRHLTAQAVNINAQTPIYSNQP